MVKGFLARRIYHSPSEWLRNALLTVDATEGSISITPFNGIEAPATTFVEGIILPFEPRFVASVSLSDYLSMNFPAQKSAPNHYWALDYPGLFAGHDTPANESAWHVTKLC